jgi:hypothetical protein
MPGRIYAPASSERLPRRGPVRHGLPIAHRQHPRLAMRVRVPARFARLRAWRVPVVSPQASPINNGGQRGGQARLIGVIAPRQHLQKVLTSALTILPIEI